MAAPRCNLAEQIFHECNLQILACLQALFPECRSGIEALEPYEDIAKLFCVLKHAQEVSLPAIQQAGENGRREVAEFRNHLERLHELLPSLHVRLLHEQDRLEQENARLNAAAEWNKISRQTL